MWPALPSAEYYQSADFHPAIRSASPPGLLDPTSVRLSRMISLVHVDPFGCMLAVRNPESIPCHSHCRGLRFRLPLRETGSATPITFDFGAILPFTDVPGLQPPCLRFAAAVTGRHARLGTRCSLGFAAAAITGD